jgi:hypothetical protein
MTIVCNDVISGYGSFTFCCSFVFVAVIVFNPNLPVHMFHPSIHLLVSGHG